MLDWNQSIIKVVLTVSLTLLFFTPKTHSIKSYCYDNNNNKKINNTFPKANSCTLFEKKT